MKRPNVFVLCGIAFSALVIAQPYRIAVVSGGSMSPTYDSGSIVLTTRSDSDLQRGDAVVFKHDNETLVKRVAFLPGDKILEFKFKESWFTPMNDFLLARVESDPMPKRWVTIPPGSIYVLGDNAPQSVDSRTFGPIPIDCVIGKVVDAPKPQLVLGFAGAEQVDHATSRVVLRRQPISGLGLQMAERYERRFKGRPYLQGSVE